MSEYGEEKSLQEILQELVTYCCQKTCNPVKLKITLPATVIGAFSMDCFDKVAQTKEHTVMLYGSPENCRMVESFHLVGGIVELECESSLSDLS